MSTKTSLISYRCRLGLPFVALATAVPAMASSERAMALAESDPSGFVMTLTAVSVVFSALALLAVIFHFIGRLMRRLEERKKAPSSGGQEHASLAKSSSGRMPSSEELVAISLALGAVRGEPNAEVAIAIALALEAERADQHDKESYRLTIRPRANTPWNARHQGMRSLPQTYF